MAPSARALPVLSITSSFFTPLVVMTSFEPLARASAFLVRCATSASRRHRYHCIAPRHTVAPYLHAAYYPPAAFPFVHALTAGDIRCAVAMRDADGLAERLRTYSLLPRLFLHPTKDLAVGHLAPADEEALLDALAVWGGATHFEASTSAPPSPGERLLFCGHELEEKEEEEDAEGGRNVRMRRADVAGAFLVASPAQAFATSATELRMGMCGGPVLNGGGDCVGVVEGVVPPQVGAPSATPTAASLLAGAAAYVPASDLVAFLRVVERQLA